jgi:hypothetical protein
MSRVAVPSRVRLGMRARLAVTVAAVVLGAVVLRLVHGGGTIGFDAMWALVWGRELAELGPVVLDTAGAPTPHPLAIAVSAPASLLGDAGIDLILALSWLAFSTLGALAFALGRALYSPWVGAVFAALLLTRPQLVLETQQALLDVPFLALVLGALLATVTSGRESWSAPALLAAAGLLRPEAWLLSFAWAAWALPHRRRDRHWLIALALVSPALWAAQDLIATGDPLFSLHATRDLAAQLARPRGLGDAIRLLPGALRATLTEPVIWLGLAGAAAALLWLESATLLPAAAAGLGMLTFLVLGVAGLPVLTRYLLVPAALLALWAAVATAGFTIPRLRGELPWRIGGAAAVAILLATLPSQLDALDSARGVAAQRGPVADDLREILDSGATREALRRCDEQLTVSDSRPRPFAAAVLDRPPASIAVQVGSVANPGVTLSYATEAAREAFAIGPATLPRPPEIAHVATNRSWIVSKEGC